MKTLKTRTGFLFIFIAKLARTFINVRFCRDRWVALMLFTIGLSGFAGSLSPVFAETVSVVNSNQQSVFEFGGRTATSKGKLWPVPSGQGVFFVGSERAFTGTLWHSNKKRTRALLFQNPALKHIIRILGVTRSYVYFLARDGSEHSVWRTSVAGNLRNTQRVKTLDSSLWFFESFGRTSGDQFVYVINVYKRISASSSSKGVKVFQIRDNARRMTDISRGLPQPGGRVDMEINEYGEILNRKLYLFIGEAHPYDRSTLAPSPGYWEVDLSGAGARKVYQMPVQRDHAKRSAVGTTVAGSSYLYSRLTKVGFGTGNCRLWGYTNAPGKSGPLAIISSYPLLGTAINTCNEEMVIASGDHLIFKNIDHVNNRIEVWETRGTQATTKRLFRFSVPGLSRKREAFHLGLNVVDNRIWFTKRDSKNRSEIWRSNPLTSGATVRFSRVWRSVQRRISVSILSAGNKPLFRINDNRQSVSLYRADASGRVLTRILTGNDLMTDIVTLEDEAVFGFRRPIGGAALLSMDLRRGKPKTRRFFGSTSWGIYDRKFTSDEHYLSSYSPLQHSQGHVYYCVVDGSYTQQWLRPNGDGKYYRASLWRSDGTQAGTRPVVMNLNVNSSSCTNYTVGQSSLYYEKYVTEIGYSSEIYRASLDGSGARLFWTHSDSTQYIKEAGNALVVVNRDPASSRTRVWRIQGNGARPVLLNNIDSDLFHIVAESKDRLWFVTGSSEQDYVGRYSLWTTDGTPAGTRLVTNGVDDINLETHNSLSLNQVNLSDLIEVGDDVYFTGAVDDVEGLYVVASGSTAAQLVVETKVLSRTIEAGVFRQYPLPKGDQTLLTEFNGRLYFVAKHKLWRYDPLSGQSLVIQESPIVNEGGTYERYVPILSLESFNGALYFIKQIRNTVTDLDWELWKTDGEPGGAVMLKQQQNGPRIKLFHNFGNRPTFRKDDNALWFIAYDRKTGHEVWRMTP